MAQNKDSFGAPILQLNKGNQLKTSIVCYFLSKVFLKFLTNIYQFDCEPKPDLLNQLISMGFDPELAKQSLIMTKNYNLQTAMDWIFENPQGIQVPSTFTEPSHSQTQINSSSKSTEDMIHFTNASNEPVVVHSKYAAQEEQKRLFREKQRLKEIEEIKKEKIRQKQEKEKLLKQMEEDRQERLERQKKSQSVNSSTSQSSKPLNTSTCLLQVSKTSFLNNNENYFQTFVFILQIRLPDGSTQKSEFKASDTLKIVKDFIVQHYTQDPSFVLMIPFPRKEFKDHMLSMTLTEADLVPRGSLTVQMISDKGVIKKAFEKVNFLLEFF